MLGIPDRSRGCLFDLDGVLTQRATVRAAAWQQMFDDILRQQAERTEDAQAGVGAGRAGHVGFVVGMDRAGQAGAPREAGADIVVRDLAELLDER